MPLLLLLAFFASALAQERPYGLEERVPNTSLLLESPGYSLADMQLRRAFPDLRFTSAVFLTHASDASGRLFIVERTGQIRLIQKERPDQASTFLDLRDRVRTSPSETGLLSAAFHPRYARNGLFYVFYTHGNLFTRVSEFRVSDFDPDRADPQSERVLLDVRQPAGNHNGGQIGFGPDGYLYIGLGDGGGAGDVYRNGQDPTTLLGAILRIDVDKRSADLPYAIPPDNPYAGNAEGWREEIWAWGLRNPWRFSFDRLNGDLWTGDVGQDKWEEVDLIVRGGNYGWNIMEGSHCFRPSVNCQTEGLVLPVAEYSHAEGRSITGGYVYRGNRLVRLWGTYLYADFVDRKIWGLKYENGQVVENRLLAISPSPVSSFGEDEQGEVYVVGFDGQLFVLDEKQTTAPPGTIPAKLSESGLFADMVARTPSPGLIPYSVNAELWSDGAHKERFIALPGSAQIGFSRDGAWEFPARSVLVKSFYLETEEGSPESRRIVETRFLVKRPAGEAWDGYSYMWNEEQTEATLLAESETRTYTIDTPAGPRQHTHYFPSRTDCNTCHTPAAGYVLGVRTAQLNGTHSYARAPDHQLRTLNHIGLFTRDIGESYEAFPRLPAPFDESEPLALRARAYLDANCAQCHRPGGNSSRSDLDLRFSAPLQETGLLERTQLDDADLAVAYILQPGAPDSSILYRRMLDTGQRRMPPLASLRVDEQGSELMSRWINSLGQPTAVLEAHSPPAAFALLANYPNPFNSTTVIPFRLHHFSRVELTVFDPLGRRVKTLLDAPLPPGAHAIFWDGADEAGLSVASGLYLYRLRSGKGVQTRKMMLLH